MATLTDLVKAIAEVQGLDQNQVLWIARYLREAGLISSGGRGRGGARMTAYDAANLLIGVNAPGSAKQSVDLVRVFRDMPLVQDHVASRDTIEWQILRSGDPFSEAFAEGKPFGPAIERLLRQFDWKDEGRHPFVGDIIEVTLSGPMLGASIYIGKDEFNFNNDADIMARFEDASTSYSSPDEFPDQEVSKKFTQRTIACIGLMLTN